MLYKARLFRIPLCSERIPWINKVFSFQFSVSVSLPESSHAREMGVLERHGWKKEVEICGKEGKES